MTDPTSRPPRAVLFDRDGTLIVDVPYLNDPAGVQRVRAIFDGTEQLPGLVLDTELRWHLLIELAAHGAVGEDEIAEHDTAAGTRRPRRGEGLVRARAPQQPASHVRARASCIGSMKAHRRPPRGRAP